MAGAWSFGLRNNAGKFLTAESFGFRINANSKVMKKKQIFFLEQEGEKVCIRTHLGRYLTATAAGDFKADAEVKGPNEMFEIEAQRDGSWALKTAHGYYAGGQGEDLRAFTKVIEADRLWTVKLAMHPQVCIMNVNRKRYAHLNGEAITCDEDIPWGDDAMLTLTFFESGQYGLQASNGKFLSNNGSLKDEADASCQFTIQFHGGQVTFRSDVGDSCYLTAVGGKGTLKASKPADAGVSKDELFIIEDSNPQIKLTAVNGRKVSSKASEISANQDQTTDTEIFQIAISNGTWTIRSADNTLWKIGADGTVAKGGDGGADSQFTIEWLGASIAIKGSNGKYVFMKKNGGLQAKSDECTDECKYVYELINRPKLVLRGEHGFVGTLPSGLIECNKSEPEVYTMHVTKGICSIKGANGKAWKVSPNGVTCSGDVSEEFTLVFVEESKFMIKCGDFYLQGAQNGAFTATGTKADPSTLWEF